MYSNSFRKKVRMKKNSTTVWTKLLKCSETNKKKKKNNIEIQNAVWVFFDVPFL